MALGFKKSDKKDVLTASRSRIINLFENNSDISLSTSGGKDSIVMCDIVYNLIKEGKIDPKKLTVRFIDEEAMFDDVIDIVHEWREKFLEVGVKFDWYCIEVKHYNCFNQLTSDESFICWDRYKKNVWVRSMPDCAINTHSHLRPRIDTYQDFLQRIDSGRASMVGLRIDESIQRRQALSRMFSNNINKKDNPQVLTGGVLMFYPIYDFTDEDIWKYILDHNLNFPKVYLHLYQIGKKKSEMRISQFFSIDTAKVLVQLSEFEPDLMERVVKREPNAYIASLYWDTEFFRRAKPGTDDKGEKLTVNYKQKVFEIFNNPGLYFTGKQQKRVAYDYRAFVLKYSEVFDYNMWRVVYNALIGGDPKERTLRSLYTKISGSIVKESNKENKKYE